MKASRQGEARERTADYSGFFAQLADDAAAEGQHADHEDHALHDGHPGAELRQVVLHGDDDRGADHRAEDRAHAAEQRHQHHLARHRPVHVGQRGELEDERLGGAGQAGQRGRQHEGQQLVAVGVVAERDGARLVLADRLQHLAEGRVDDAVDDQPKPARKITSTTPVHGQSRPGR
jgi:hypothetical protein